MSSRITTIPTFAVAAALLAATMLVAGCGAREGDTPDLGLKPGSGQTGGVTASGTVDASDSANPKAPGTAGEGNAKAGGDAGASGSNGAGSSGSTSGGTPGSNGSGASSSAPKVIRINWWNDTSAKAPKNPSVVFAGKSVKPKAGKSAVMSIGPCPVGKDLELVIYPDGPSGRKIVATFRVDAAMVANSDQDAIHVEVRDDRVRVLGNPIPNFEKSFDR